MSLSVPEVQNLPSPMGPAAVRGEDNSNAVVAEVQSVSSSMGPVEPAEIDLNILGPEDQNISSSMVTVQPVLLAEVISHVLGPEVEKFTSSPLAVHPDPESDSEVGKYYPLPLPDIQDLQETHNSEYPSELLGT